MARPIERIEIPPMTPEEQQRWRVALKRAERFRSELLAERGGRPFNPASEDLAAIREERERDYDRWNGGDLR